MRPVVKAGNLVLVGHRNDPMAFRCNCDAPRTCVVCDGLASAPHYVDGGKAVCKACGDAVFTMEALGR